jgi:hypothetical protein
MSGLAGSILFVESPAALTVNGHGLGHRSAMRFACGFGNHTKDSGTLAAIAFSLC